MGSPAFIDTNIPVYAEDRDEPAKQQRAREIFADASLSLSVSTQVLLEFISVSTKKLETPLTMAEAIAVAGRLAQLTVVNADARLVLSAAELAAARQLSIWDAMIVRTAQLAGCTTLLSEDLQDGARFGELTVVNPFAAIG